LDGRGGVVYDAFRSDSKFNPSSVMGPEVVVDVVVAVVSVSSPKNLAITFLVNSKSISDGVAVELRLDQEDDDDNILDDDDDDDGGDGAFNENPSTADCETTIAATIKEHDRPLKPVIVCLFVKCLLRLICVVAAAVAVVFV
jgi:hypothetical protein